MGLVPFHRREKGNCAADIDIEAAQRFRHLLADRLEARKMNDGVDVVGLEGVVEQRPVAQVAGDDDRCGMGECGNPGRDIPVGIREVVENDYPIASPEDGRSAEVSCSGSVREPGMVPLRAFGVYLSFGPIRPHVSES